MSFWIRACFFLSGVAALLYQMLWFRLLGQVLGTSIQALGIVTATFMGGLALGGFLLGPLADRSGRPLRLYAVIEIGIAGFGGLVVWSSKPIASLVAELGGALGVAADGSYVLRVVVASAILLVPCTLIGGTLPVMIRAVVRSIPELGEGVGTLYFANTLGAAVGVLASGLVLFESIGLRGTALVAMGMNFAVAAASVLIEPRLPAAAPIATPAPHEPSRLRAVAVVAFFLSGFSGLALEVLWTRVLFGFVAAGSRSFHVLLATLLVGLALGGIVGARFADKAKAPLAAAGIAFAAVGVLVLVGLEQIGALAQLAIGDRVSVSHLAFAPIVGMVFPAALAMGALFPFIVKGLLVDLGRLGRDAGRYYAVNTLGTVAGALTASFVAIPLVGVSQTIVAIALANLAVGFALLWLTHRLRGPQLALFGVIALCSVVYARSAGNSFHTALQAQATREYPQWSQEAAYVEGSESTVMLYREAPPRSRHRVEVNAFPMVALSTRETKLMAHIPMLAAPDPLRTLIICFGMGNTYRSALSYGSNIDVVDINRHIPEFTKIHRGPNDKTLKNPHGHVYINDGRNHLLMSTEIYDVISVDPAPPIWSMGMQNLYSRDFFELARDRLSERGIMMEWTPSETPKNFLPILRAFMDTFPYVEIFQGLDYPDAHYLLGSKSPIVYDETVIEGRLAGAEVAADVAEFDQQIVNLLRSMYRIDKLGLAETVAAVEPLTDDHPVLEYQYLRTDQSTGLFGVPDALRGRMPWRAASE